MNKKDKNDTILMCLREYDKIENFAGGRSIKVEKGKWRIYIHSMLNSISVYENHIGCEDLLFSDWNDELRDYVDSLFKMANL